MKKKGVLILLIVIAAAAVAGFFVYQYRDSLFGGGEKGASGSGIAVMPVSSFAESASTNNRYSGVVETQKKESVKLDTNKKVKDILVEKGDHVMEGDPLFSYDTEAMDLEIQQRQIDIERINAQIVGYNEQVAELTKLMNAENVSTADRLNYSAQILEAQTAVAQAEYDKKTKDAEISKLQAAMGNAVVKAPMTGTVEELKDPESIYDETTAFITIIADGDFRVKGTVSEQNIQSVSEGVDVIVRSRVDSSVTWKGHVTGIETKPETSDQSEMVYYGGGSDAGNTASKYVFYVELDSMDGLLLGQHVTIEEDPGELTIPEGIYVPDGFVVFEEGQNPYVWAVSKPGDRLEKREVETGVLNEDIDRYEILSGLSETDYIAWPDPDCATGAMTVAG